MGHVGAGRTLSNLTIRDVRHLCLLLGTNRDELDAICRGIDSHPHEYYRFKAIERNGKKRSLAIPYGRFQKLLKKLNALLQRLEFPSNMHGGLRGRTTRTYAKSHVRKQALLKSDISDFFPSVASGRVYNMFHKQLSCTPDVSRYLTRLTTVNGQLPQGSPTSTVIANLVVTGMARRLEGLANCFQGQSGTFVDDVALSGPRYVGNFRGTLKKIIRQEGFTANESKTRTLVAGREQVIAGIRVDRGLDVPSEKLRELRALIDGVGADVSRGMSPQSATIRSIRGKIRYVALLNKGAAKALEKKLRAALGAS